MLKKTPRGAKMSEDEMMEVRHHLTNPDEYHDLRLAQADRDRLLKHIEWLEYQLELRDDECERLRRSL